MKTQTDYYGEIEYNLSDLIVVADGFFGFPELKQFLPLRLDEDNDSLLYSFCHDISRIIADFFIAI